MRSFIFYALVLMTIPLVSAGELMTDEEQPMSLGAHIQLYQMGSKSHVWQCQIKVGKNDITSQNWDHWVLGRKYERDVKSEHPWNVCQNRIECLSAENCFKFKCKRCENDHIDALRICRAEKGTEITLFDNKKGSYSDDAVDIVMLKDWKETSCSNPLIIENLERSRDTEYYKVRYIKRGGSLNREVSSVIMRFPHRSGR